MLLIIEFKIHDLPVFCNAAIYVDYTTHYSKCNHTSDLWELLVLAYTLESDPWDTLISLC